MDVSYTATQLAAFEDDIAAEFNAGRIKAPVHLESGNEERLIRIFRDHIQADDWLLCTWRSHLKCLLKGVPPAVLKAEIMAGHSMGLCFPDYRILSSAIVGGILPIAVGLAMGLKRQGSANRVICFVGDMTEASGIMHECVQYATSAHQLPLLFVVEDNGKSTNTPTRETWGSQYELHYGYTPLRNVLRYQYQSKYPHSGAGQWVQF